MRQKDEFKNAITSNSRCGEKQKRALKVKANLRAWWQISRYWLRSIRYFQLGKFNSTHRIRYCTARNKNRDTHTRGRNHFKSETTLNVECTVTIESHDPLRISFMAKLIYDCTFSILRQKNTLSVPNTKPYSFVSKRSWKIKIRY